MKPPQQVTPEVQNPQHIAEILPDVLARYGLVPADVWAEPAACEYYPVVPVELAFSEVCLPMSIS